MREVYATYCAPRKRRAEIEMFATMRRHVVLVAKLATALLAVSGVALVAFAGWLVWHYEYGIGLPDHAKLTAISATDQICSASHSRTFVPLAEIPLRLRSAFLALEEPDFYDRPPINIFTEVALAFLLDRRPRAATISTYVTRCLMPPECCRGLDRPIGALVLLHRVERVLSKDLIFESYLNNVYLGRGINGVATAATSYFGKSLGELNLDEIVFIVTRARWPFPSQHRDFENNQRNFAIDRMLQAGVMSEAEAASAREHPLMQREKAELQDKPAGAGDNRSLP